MKSLTKFALNLAVIMSISTSCIASDAKKSDACLEIENKCKIAGFLYGEFGVGKGLWNDCICRILKKSSGIPSTPTLSLPPVDKDLVNACHKAHPKFCEDQGIK